ncbi:MAG: class I SAM-dependent methyltransferase [Planctomycetota bacterium]
MSYEAGDTSARSLAHWSEDARSEMDAFYRVATLDYRELARAWNWNGFFRERLAERDELRILDVACGSGRFPTALREHTGLGELDGTPLVLDLLDPSAFSLREAHASLAPPMVGGRQLECTLQGLPKDAADYDLVWAVHALYALPSAELDRGVEAFVGALAPNGLGVVAHARRSSHYIAFYDAYLERRETTGTPYTDAETIEEAFRRKGADVEVIPVRYQQVVESESVLEGFLQRCLFDTELDLAEMRSDPVLGPYLAERRGRDGVSRFDQDVSLIFIRR